MNRVPNFGPIPGVKDKPIVGMTAGTIFLAASIAIFTLYAPLAYGNMWTKAECNRVKLFEKWDWDCNTFHDNVSSTLYYPSASWQESAKSNRKI